MNRKYYESYNIFESKQSEKFNPQYGVPEQEKYPLYDKKHVISAIRLFGHVEPRFEEKLAKAIIAKMKKYEIPFSMVGKDNKLYNYIPKAYLTESSSETFVELHESKFNIENYKTPEEVAKALEEYKAKKEDLLKHESDYPSAVFQGLDNIIKSLEDKHVEMLKESDNGQNTIILNKLRADFQDEFTAIKNYDEHADLAELHGLSDVAEVLRDIRDEEKVHVGELQALLNKYDPTYEKSVESGEKEISKLTEAQYRTCPDCGANLDSGEICECKPKYPVNMGGKIINNNSNSSNDTPDEQINESVLDPVQKTRCREIFDENDKMRPEVKKFIIDTFMDWKKNLDVDFPISGIYLIGSSASFQYTETSDVDITILSDKFDEDKYWEIVRMLPNGNNIPNTEKPINYFIQDNFQERLAENIYDIQNDKWIKQSSPDDVQIPHSYILELAKFFMNAVDLTLSEYERDKIAYLEYKALDPEKVDISEEERLDAMNSKLEELKSDLDSIRIGNHLIRGFVHDAYNDEENYFKISIELPNKSMAPQKSVNNLVYKTLEKYGYREKIDNFIKDAKAFIAEESMTDSKKKRIDGMDI